MSDGRVIKDNLFYRSGIFQFNDENDTEHLKSLGLKSLLDYRGDNNKGDGYEFIDEGVFSISASDHLPTVERFNEAYKMTADESFELMCDYYRFLPFNNPAYQNMVNVLRMGAVPMLQCCTAGKDRTGVGVAILLMILGADKDVIINNYMETQDHYNEIFSSDYKLLEQKYGIDDVDTMIKPRIHNELQTKIEFIDAMYEAIHNKYETIEDYLLYEFSLDKNEIARLRDKYLTFESEV